MPLISGLPKRLFKVNQLKPVPVEYMHMTLVGHHRWKQLGSKHLHHMNKRQLHFWSHNSSGPMTDLFSQYQHKLKTLQGSREANSENNQAIHAHAFCGQKIGRANNYVGRKISCLCLVPLLEAPC